jgi:hypothetical protein
MMQKRTNLDFIGPQSTEKQTLGEVTTQEAGEEAEISQYLYGR